MTMNELGQHEKILLLDLNMDQSASYPMSYLELEDKN